MDDDYARSDRGLLSNLARRDLLSQFPWPPVLLVNYFAEQDDNRAIVEQLFQTVQHDT